MGKLPELGNMFRGISIHVSQLTISGLGFRINGGESVTFEVMYSTSFRAYPFPRPSGRVPKYTRYQLFSSRSAKTAALHN